MAGLGDDTFAAPSDLSPPGYVAVYQSTSLFFLFQHIFGRKKISLEEVVRTASEQLNEHISQGTWKNKYKNVCL